MFIVLAGIDVSRVYPENWITVNVVIGVIGMVLTVVGYTGRVVRLDRGSGHASGKW